MKTRQSYVPISDVPYLSIRYKIFSVTPKMYTVSSGTSSIQSKGVARPINLAPMEKPTSARMFSSNVSLIP